MQGIDVKYILVQLYEMVREGGHQWILGNFAVTAMWRATTAGRHWKRLEGGGRPPTDGRHWVRRDHTTVLIRTCAAPLSELSDKLCPSDGNSFVASKRYEDVYHPNDERRQLASDGSIGSICSCGPFSMINTMTFDKIVITFLLTISLQFLHVSIIKSSND